MSRGTIALAYLTALMLLGSELHAIPPRITTIEPPPEADGLWVVQQSGLSQVRVEFDQMVTVPEGAVTVWTAANGLITDATVLQDTLSSVQITFAAAIHQDRVTIVVDHSTTNFQGEFLDGQIGDPHDPAFPSGNGRPGGLAVFRYNVLAGDVNRDGFVDTLDVQALQSALGSCVGDPAYSAQADLNGDDCINVLDINVLLHGLGGMLPPTGNPLQIVSITPDPAAPLDNPISQVSIEFTAAVAPEFLFTNSCFLVSDDEIIAPISVSLAPLGTVATYTFSPAAAQCGQHHLEISNSITDASGTLLSGISAAQYSGFTLPPTPSIDRHAILTTSTTIKLTGTAAEAVSVQVVGNGGTATAASGGGSFAITAPLQTNALNTLYVSGVSACDVASPPATTQVIMDAQPPSVSILFPQNSLEVTDDAINVSGNVGDLLSGQFGLSVTVNGMQANVNPGIGTNGTFEVTGLPLNVGPNLITATATDAAGNIANTSVTVTRQAIPRGAPILLSVSGDQQDATVNTQLPLPIVVQVLRADRTPFANKLVNFTVSRSNGTLSDQSGSPTDTQLLQVFTDSSGFATAFWTLGSDSGSGNNRVTVSSAGIAGTVFFVASGTPGAASRIVISANNNQRAQAGGSLPLPLIARVIDGQNPVSGVPVTFTVLTGDGSIADGTEGAFARNAGTGSEVVVVTGPDGIARGALTLGPSEGLNRVQADFNGNTGIPIVFTAHGIESVPGEPTTFTGLVLDNGDRAIGGAQAMLKVNGQNLRPVSTDVNGRFVMTDVPAGAGMLYVNASMATTLAGKPIPPGSFPALQFADVVIVPGAENHMPAPVRLPALNPNNQANYSTTQETVLTIEGMDGLRFVVAPGSMTLADGNPAPNGTLMRLNQVHFDQTPMPLPDDTANPFAWTLLPGAATFDPPIRIEMPNMTGLPPGSVSYFSSFNHDTGRFEICGTGSVTADGSMIISDPGSGISISGWGSFVPPPPPPPPPQVGSCGGGSGLNALTTCCSEHQDNINSLQAARTTWLEAFSHLNIARDRTTEAQAALRNAHSHYLSIDSVFNELADDFEVERADLAFWVSQCPLSPAGCSFFLTALACELFCVAYGEWVEDDLEDLHSDLANYIIHPNYTEALEYYNSTLNKLDAALLELDRAGQLWDATSVIIQNLYVECDAAVTGWTYLNLFNEYPAKEAALRQKLTYLKAKLNLLKGSIDRRSAETLNMANVIFAELDTWFSNPAAAPFGSTPCTIVVPDGGEITFDLPDGDECPVDPEFLPPDPEIMAIGQEQLDILAIEGALIAQLTDELIVEISPLADVATALFETTDLINERLFFNGWTARARGVEVPFDPFGHFNLENVPRHHERVNDFGGSAAPMRIFAEGPGPDGRLYATSPVVYIGSGSLVLNSPLVATDVPPVRAVSLTVEPAGIITLEQGDGITLNVIGQMSDGLTQVINTSAESTYYVRSNRVISMSTIVNPDVFAEEVGVCFVSVFNEGVAATKIIHVVSKTAQTTVAGIVTLEDGTPVEGAVVTSLLGGQDSTAADGSFSFPVTVSAGAPNVSLTAVATIQGVNYVGAGLASPIIHNGISDAGIIVVKAEATGRCDQLDWIPTFAGQTGLPSANSMAVLDDGSGGGPALYAGTNNSVMKWTGTTWTAVGSGFGATSLVVFNDGSGPALHAAMSGGVRKWNGSTWTLLGSGISGSVMALAVFNDGSGPALFAAGIFDTAGGVPANCIAKWNGNAWSALGSGLQLSGGAGEAYSLTVFDDATGGGPALFVGGVFDNAGGTPAVSVAKWNGATWSTLGGGVGVPGGVVLSLEIFDDGTGGGPVLHAGGDWDFSEFGSIAKWNGTAWVAVPITGGPTGIMITSLTPFNDGTGPGLYVTSLNDTTIKRWNGSTWSSTGVASDGAMAPVTIFDDGLGGGPALHAARRPYTNTGDPVAISRWIPSSSTWTDLGGPLGGGAVNGIVRAMTVVNDGPGGAQNLYAGGDFQRAGGILVRNIAKWDGAAWTPLATGTAASAGGSGAGGMVSAIASANVGGSPSIYIGGGFLFPGTRIARWNGTTWSALGSGMNNIVSALAEFDDGSGGGPALFAAGQFTTAGGVPANRIAKWNGSAWSVLDSGLTGAGFALTVFDDGTGGGPALFVGGNFAGAGGQPAVGIAKWDGTQWSAVGGGMNSNVSSLVVFDDGSGPALYAGGGFTVAGGVAAPRVAKWDGTQWSALGTGMNNQVLSLGVFDDGSGSGPALFATGSFSIAGSQPANRIAKWNGIDWEPLGTGLTGGSAGLALATFGIGAAPDASLIVGGDFTGNPAGTSFMSRWACVDAPLTNQPQQLAATGGVSSSQSRVPIKSFGGLLDLRLRPGETLLIGDQTVRLRSLYAEAGSHISITHPNAHLIVEDMTIEPGVIFEWIAGTIEIAGGTWLHPEEIRIGCFGPRGPDSSEARLVLSGGGTAVVIAPSIYVCQPGAIEGEGNLAAPTTSSGTIAPMGSGLLVAADYRQQPDGALIASPKLNASHNGVTAAMLQVDGEAVVSGAIRANSHEPLVCGDSFLVLASRAVMGRLESNSAIGASCHDRIIAVPVADGLRATVVPDRASADVNCDGVIDVNDMAALLSTWGDCPSDCCRSDVFPTPHGDGFINVEDLVEIMARIEAAERGDQLEKEVKP